MRLIGLCFGIMACFQVNAMIVFDVQNLVQNIAKVQQGAGQLQQGIDQINQLKKQATVFKQELKIQEKAFKKNFKKLDFSAAKDLRTNFKKTRRLLAKNKALSKELFKLDAVYNQTYQDSPDISKLPSAEQNKKIQTQLDASLKSNQQAMDALQVLESYEADHKNTQDLIEHSQKAEGTLQALQSSNQLSGIAIKNTQELKLLMARDLEQRSLVLSQDNLNKQRAYHNNKQFWATPKKTKKTNKTFPKLGSSTDRIL